MSHPLREKTPGASPGLSSLLPVEKIVVVTELEALDHSSCVGPWLTGTAYSVTHKPGQGQAAGRPRSGPITKAVELCTEGVPWQDMYERVIPGYRELGARDRRAKARLLRTAVQMRSYRRQRRSRGGF